MNILESCTSSLHLIGRTVSLLLLFFQQENGCAVAESIRFLARQRNATRMYYMAECVRMQNTEIKDAVDTWDKSVMVIVCLLSNIRMSLPESLLTSSVPNLQFDRLSTNIDDPGTKLHTDGVVGVLFNCNMNTEKRVKNWRQEYDSRKLLYL